MREQLERLIRDLVDRGIPFEDAARIFERGYIAQVLEKTDHNLSQAAARLGMHRNTLSRKVDEYRLRRR